MLTLLCIINLINVPSYLFQCDYSLRMYARDVRFGFPYFFIRKTKGICLNLILLGIRTSVT